MTTDQQETSSGESARSAESARGAVLDGSPLDTMLTDAALGPLRRLLPGVPGVRFVGRLARRPGTVVRTTTSYGAELAKIVAGRSEVEPDKRDRRFADPAWTGNPLLHRLVQLYLRTGGTVDELIAAAELDWRDDQRVRFIAENILDAAAPSNVPLLNPTSLKVAVDTGGRNFATGLAQLVKDMSAKPRIPAMVDTDPFTVGGNLAVTDGSVVLRTPVFELIQYRPRTETVREVPLLLVPPMINKFYVADLAPGRSMIEYFADSGQQVFAMSWRNPAEEHRDWNLDTYAQAVVDALDATETITGSTRSHMLGLCAGGIVASTAVAHLAANGEGSRIAGLTLGVTMLDQERSGTVGSFVDRRTAELAVADSARRGYLDGRALAGVFAWLRPNDLIWNYWVNNYLLGRKPPAFDVLYWNADTTRMPAGLHRDFLHIAVDNALVQPGRATVLGSPVDLSKVTVDSYVVAGIADHICPWQNCYATTRLLGSEPRFVLSSSGHIAALVNPPGNEKSNFQVAEHSPADPHDWLTMASRHSGTWWTDWTRWVAQRSGADKPAPSSLGAPGYEPLADAPGSYVCEQ